MQTLLYGLTLSQMSRSCPRVLNGFYRCLRCLVRHHDLPHSRREQSICIARSSKTNVPRFDPAIRDRDNCAYLSPIILVLHLTHDSMKSMSASTLLESSKRLSYFAMSQGGLQPFLTAFRNSPRCSGVRYTSCRRFSAMLSS